MFLPIRLQVREVIGAAPVVAPSQFGLDGPFESAYLVSWAPFFQASTVGSQSTIAPISNTLGFSVLLRCLVEGRKRIYFEHLWNDFAADKARSIPEEDRKAYTLAYARPGRMTAGFAYFASFLRTAAAFSNFAKSSLAMPVLSIGGEKSLGAALDDQGSADC
jgi:hypothetical protein